MRTRLSIATNGNVPSPVAQTTTRKGRGQSRPPGTENADPTAPGTISWKVTKRGPKRGGAMSELDPGTASKRTRTTAQRKRQGRQDEDSDEELSVVEDLTSDEDEDVTRTVNGKGKGRASRRHAPATSTRKLRTIPASAGRAGGPSTSRSRGPTRASSVLTAPPDSTSHTAQSASDHPSPIIPSTASSAMPLSRKGKGKEKESSACLQVTVGAESDERLDDPEVEESTLLDEADRNILDQVDEPSQDQVEVVSPKLDVEEHPSADAVNDPTLSASSEVKEEMEDDERDRCLGDVSTERDDGGGTSMVDETKLLDKEPGLMSENTEVFEKQYANSEDSFDSRPYPRRNLLPNFLSTKGSAVNPFLAPPLPSRAAEAPLQVQVHPPAPQPAVSPPAVGTKQLLLGRGDPCVCGAERYEDMWIDEHRGGGEDEGKCMRVVELKGKGWRIYREV